jgi:Na+/proline symporter
MSVLPPGLYVLLLGALISAILSTINSVLLAVTALVGHNVIIPMFPGMSERGKVLTEKGIVVVTGIICYLMAIGGDSIYGLAELASSFGSAGLVVCVLIGLNSRWGGGKAALATLLGGIIFTLVTNYVIETEAPYLMALAGCLIVYVTMSLWEKQCYARQQPV